MSVFNTASDLRSDLLTDIAKGHDAAVLIKSFVDTDLAGKISDKLLHCGYDPYINAPTIGRIGMAFYETETRIDLINKYFDTSKVNIDRLRSACLPYASPIDILRCKLDEIWKAGACLERIYGKTMFVGLSRVLSPNTWFLAHHDHLEKDAPDSGYAASLVGQLAFNIYLGMPKKGGGLQIWNKEIPPDEFDKMRGESYGVSPDLLGDPDFTIQPEAGDLVIFNSRKMHAVTPPEGAPRVSLSCFVGYRGDHMPLTYWS